MENLIDIEKLLQEVKKGGVKLGKGDPYNRLRYYTKIGWLPHMSRKKGSDGTVKGHYPRWVIERIIKIEKLKAKGATNEEISNKLSTQKSINSLYTNLNSDAFRTKIGVYVTIALLLVILFVESGLLTTTKNDKYAPQPLEDNESIQIMQSGAYLLPQGKSTVFVPTKNVKTTSKIYVTFQSNYSPATRYWVGAIKEGNGFEVNLDAPVIEDSYFSWWLSH